MKTTSRQANPKVENAKKTAQAKVYFWAGIQTRHYHRNRELKAAGQPEKAAWQFRMEMRAAHYRYKAEIALEKLYKMG